MLIQSNPSKVGANISGALREAQELATTWNWRTRHEVSWAYQMGTGAEQEAAARFLELAREIPSGVTVYELSLSLKGKI